MPSFKCQRCGSCCKQAKRMVEIIPQLASVIKPDENGWCQFLRELSAGIWECLIYEDRPLVCNVQWMAEHRAKDIGVDMETYYLIAEDACRKLKEL